MTEYNVQTPIEILGTVALKYNCCVGDVLNAIRAGYKTEDQLEVQLSGHQFVRLNPPAKHYPKVQWTSILTRNGKEVPVTERQAEVYAALFRFGPLAIKYIGNRIYQETGHRIFSSEIRPVIKALEKKKLVIPVSQFKCKNKVVSTLWGVLEHYE